jgi:hypothetical protein
LKTNVLCLSARNRRNRFEDKLAVFSQKAAWSGCTGLSGGAPDSVRCARTGLDEHPALGSRRRRTAINHRTVRWCTGLSGGAPDCPVSRLRRSRRSRETTQLRPAKNHRTVRWCTGLSGEPTVGRANGRPRNPRVTRGRANGRMGAPDCPVRQRLQTFNGRLRQIRKAIHTEPCPVVHRTVRCATRQKARFAFLECFQQLLAALGL